LSEKTPEKLSGLYSIKQGLHVLRIMAINIKQLWSDYEQKNSDYLLYGSRFNPPGC
jgi:hypothetical protein